MTAPERGLLKGLTARQTIARLPSVPGVYRFRDPRGRVLYIGRASHLRHRVGSYWSDLGERPHLAAMVRRIARIEAVACESGHEAAWLERNLLETSLPPWNRTPGGQEVPVYIHMDERPRRPSLTVVHLSGPAAGVREFGPSNAIRATEPALRAPRRWGMLFACRSTWTATTSWARQLLM